MVATASAIAANAPTLKRVHGSPPSLWASSNARTSQRSTTYTSSVCQEEVHQLRHQVRQLEESLRLRAEQFSKFAEEVDGLSALTAPEGLPPLSRQLGELLEDHALGESILDKVEQARRSALKQEDLAATYSSSVQALQRRLHAMASQHVEHSPATGWATTPLHTQRSAPSSRAATARHAEAERWPTAEAERGPGLEEAASLGSSGIQALRLELASLGAEERAHRAAVRQARALAAAEATARAAGTATALAGCAEAGDDRRALSAECQAWHAVQVANEISVQTSLALAEMKEREVALLKQVHVAQQQKAALEAIISNLFPGDQLPFN
jgi:hypothetical protein